MEVKTYFVSAEYSTNANFFVPDSPNTALAMQDSYLNIEETDLSPRSMLGVRCLKPACTAECYKLQQLDRPDE